MTVATTSGAELNAALKPQLKALVDDMRARLNGDEASLAQWRGTYDDARKQERTAVAWTDWSEDQLTQASVGWLLTSVFVRFCEDNLLLGDTGVWITSRDTTLRQRALDAENGFYRSNPDASYREWLQVAFDALGSSRATASLVDDHAAIHIFAPSSDAVQRLLEFWRTTDDDGALVWTFADPELETRFLGDLYQDLSDFAKKKYALLQTPVFVEEFILDQTMEPALNDRPLEGFKIIDPTCGSGHFLLGAFDRLLGRWRAQAPAMEPRALADKALESIYGVDLNPFAVSIAQFRLLVAAMKASSDSSLVGLPAFTLNVINGDSLLHGPDSGGRDALDYGDSAFDKDAVVTGFAYSTEDRTKLAKFLAPGQYDCVVGNPPYITVKDKALNARYRELYKPYCKGPYALTAPFMVRFFALAKNVGTPGTVGQITSNSFMKRRFGIPLIEDFLPSVEITTVIDSEGAWIPGHNMDGTPTTIIVGRNTTPRSDKIRAVLSKGVREMPSDITNDGYGPYWSAIISKIGTVGHEDHWISVADLDRLSLGKHPWTLAGGGAIESLRAIELAGTTKLSDHVLRVGYYGMTHADDAFLFPPQYAERLKLTASFIQNCAGGDVVRNWATRPTEKAIVPYQNGLPVEHVSDLGSEICRHFWPIRTTLGTRAAFNGGTYFSENIRWHSWHQLPADAGASAITVTFAEVASHNHFTIHPETISFKQSAPVIKFASQITEAECQALLGILNSSVACFWLKQKCKPKGGASGKNWARTYQFNGKMVEQIPIPGVTSASRTKFIVYLAERIESLQPSTLVTTFGPSVDFDSQRKQECSHRSELLSEQEELDWDTYYSYGLTPTNLSMPPGTAPGISVGERSFEILLARQPDRLEADADWFVEQHATSITEVPSRWPSEYRQLVQRRLQVIGSNPIVRLLETPEYKRRWNDDSWDVKLRSALQKWLLDQLEEPTLWFTQQGTPRALSVAELAAHVETLPEFVRALDLWAGRKDAPVTKTLEKLLREETVPFLSDFRYTPPGLRKRAEWEMVWELQRQEDAGLVQAHDIPAAPKYTNADFQKTSYWHHRGKLDIPKERFISYPGLGRATDTTPLLGWAGWNHAYQGLTLATIFSSRQSEGMSTAKLQSVWKGIIELTPWIRLWNNKPDPRLGVNLADYLADWIVTHAPREA